MSNTLKSVLFWVVLVVTAVVVYRLLIGTVIPMAR
jgi:hypothetical protein